MFSPQSGPKRDLTGPRKELSVSDRRRLDTAQAEAIDAYRQMKAGRSVRSSAVTWLYIEIYLSIVRIEIYTI